MNLETWNLSPFLVLVISFIKYILSPFIYTWSFLQRWWPKWGGFLHSLSIYYLLDIFCVLQQKHWFLAISVTFWALWHFIIWKRGHKVITNLDGFENKMSKLILVSLVTLWQRKKIWKYMQAYKGKGYCHILENAEAKPFPLSALWPWAGHRFSLCTFSRE